MSKHELLKKIEAQSEVILNLTRVLEKHICYHQELGQRNQKELLDNIRDAVKPINPDRGM